MQVERLCFVCAGNEDVDACKISPANLDVVITVGASEVDNKFNPGQQEHDTLYTWSNTGTCVDLFAPGMLTPQPWFCAWNSNLLVPVHTISA